MKSLSGKTAIVTGASQGIGRAIAERLGRDGAAVVVNYANNREGGEEVAKNISDNGGRAIAVHADVAKLADIGELFEQCVRSFGKPDILVNNAGVGTLMPLTEMTEDEYDRVFNINAKGTLFCLKAAAEHLNDGGRVVNISSSTTMFPMKGAAIYAASKATIKEYTKIAALELGERGITVNTVMPGITQTPMTERLPAELKESVAHTSPFNRLGEPRDIADAVAFLVGDDARWITGQQILVNGGAKQ